MNEDDLVLPQLGDKKRFKPCGWIQKDQVLALEDEEIEVTGEVIFIHWPHRYYRVEYVTASGCIGHECFKF